MWYEALPSLAIIGTCIMVYQYGGVLISKAFLDRPYGLDFTQEWRRHLAERDTRLSGSPYIQRGLDSIPDE